MNLAAEGGTQQVQFDQDLEEVIGSLVKTMGGGRGEMS